MRCGLGLVAFCSRREEVEFALALSDGTWPAGVLRLESVVRLVEYLMRGAGGIELHYSVKKSSKKNSVGIKVTNIYHFVKGMTK